jgi:hypothetical protein
MVVYNTVTLGGALVVGVIIVAQFGLWAMIGYLPAHRDKRLFPIMSIEMILLQVMSQDLVQLLGRIAGGYL